MSEIALSTNLPVALFLETTVKSLVTVGAFTVWVSTTPVIVKVGAQASSIVTVDVMVIEIVFVSHGTCDDCETVAVAAIRSTKSGSSPTARRMAEALVWLQSWIDGVAAACCDAGFLTSNEITYIGPPTSVTMVPLGRVHAPWVAKMPSNATPSSVISVMAKFVVDVAVDVRREIVMVGTHPVYDVVSSGVLVCKVTVMVFTAQGVSSECPIWVDSRV